LSAVLMPALLTAEMSIFRPNIGVPAFPLTNGAFNVEIESTPGLASNGWGVLLVNDLRSWTCSVERVEYGQYVYCNSATGYLLTARAPVNMAPEVFNLQVSHDSAGSATNRHCVKILRNYETDFYVLHYADPQVETENATSANGGGGSHGSVQAIYWASSAYSLINPRFMFNTGDEVENGVAGFYPKYLEAINVIKAPLLITRGNNDAKGDFTNWKRDVGQPTYSITIGSFYVCMKDYGTNESLSWFTNDYAASFADSNITFRLFGQHYTNGGFAYNPPAGQYPDLMLVGHNHAFATLSTNPYYVLSSGPGWDYGAVAIFEFVKTNNGWVCSNKTIHGTTDKLQVYGDWGQPCLVTNTFLYANNGTMFTNTTYITNSLNYDFLDGQIRFLMRKTAAGYTASGGEITGEYDYSLTNTAVVVKVNIRGNALTTVAVLPLNTNKQPQTISFPSIADQNVTSTVGLSATASSGLPVSFIVAGGHGTISGATNLAFNGTGLVSIVAGQAGNNDWYAAPNVTNSFMVTSSIPVSAASSGVCADYDGDAFADPAIYDEITGTWKVKLSSAGYYLIVTTLNGLGGHGRASVAADYDGDRKADPAVYQELTGTWLVLPSSLNYAVVLAMSGPLGGIGYSGMPADYDGDRKADPGVYQRERGDWQVMFSTANYYAVEALGLLGGAGYLAVAADYDGDGKADPAIYGESTGYWIFKLSGIGYVEIALAHPLGGAGYLPVPADYDGDGLTDPAVRSIAGNEWIVMFSTGGYLPVQLTVVFD